MFYLCEILTSLNLSNFNTSKVESMNRMFYQNNKLGTINLSGFDISHVTDMAEMFGYCRSLKVLDLSSFENSDSNSMEKMFSVCWQLKYINLSNFIEKESTSYIGIFNEVEENIVVCINESNHKIISELKKKSCYVIDCSKDWELKRRNIVNKKSICKTNYNKYITYKYEYNGKYYEHCVNGNLINNSTITSCDCDKEKCESCPLEH